MALLFPKALGQIIGKRLRNCQGDTCYQFNMTEQQSCRVKKNLLINLGLAKAFGNRFNSYVFLYKLLSLFPPIKNPSPSRFYAAPNAPLYINIGGEPIVLSERDHMTEPVVAVLHPGSADMAMHIINTLSGGGMDITLGKFSHDTIIYEHAGKYVLQSMLVKYATHIVAYVRCSDGWYLFNNERSKYNLPMLQIPFDTCPRHGVFDHRKLLSVTHKRLSDSYVVCIYVSH